MTTGRSGTVSTVVARPANLDSVPNPKHVVSTNSGTGTCANAKCKLAASVWIALKIKYCIPTTTAHALTKNKSMNLKLTERTMSPSNGLTNAKNADAKTP